jgi:hypothetical protein
MCTLYLKINDESGQEVGRVVDISEGGMLIVLEEAMDVGTELFVSIPLPKAWGELEPMEVKILCRWTSMDVAEGYYISGMEVVLVSKRDKDYIKRILEDFTFEGRYRPFPDLLYEGP